MHCIFKSKNKYSLFLFQFQISQYQQKKNLSIAKSFSYSLIKPYLTFLNVTQFLKVFRNFINSNILREFSVLKDFLLASQSWIQQLCFRSSFFQCSILLCNLKEISLNYNRSLHFIATQSFRIIMFFSYVKKYILYQEQQDFVQDFLLLLMKQILLECFQMLAYLEIKKGLGLKIIELLFHFYSLLIQL
ncbi:unnamed protein product (macronuclear) [Paramecium tetraurelia]|uniref:Transmembrane protein n=1 Tax=Paramecium tetraurelia TaxID=5888 RepID=A0D9K9_PARTE|nr:uncharacterized protein GSPATT00014656001 [Paramecium tetraurelia]CAK79726.1 unnamed protein product [Paramecium tetraurelia]|eukprot:XP_001447123.1 hypothetical protein (macronuclear) [Paramecium tetraurelia strain d4-2]